MQHNKAKMITILAAGSRGDTQPYIALGRELIKHGMQVRMATFEKFRELVEQAGLEYSHLEGDISAAAATAEKFGAIQADNPLKVLLSFNKMKDLAAGMQSEFFNACEGADAIVYHPGAVIGQFIAQERGIPGILATPFPMQPTDAYPSLLFYHLPRLGKAYNLLTHKIFEEIMWFASKSTIKKMWCDKYEEKPKSLKNPFHNQHNQQFPTVISCSKHVFPIPDDWLPNIHMTGYWFLDQEENWDPPADLVHFLGSGAAPVYVGFGSMSNAGPAAQQLTEIIVKALMMSGQRGIIATGWNGLSADEGHGDDIYFLESAPHGWLFPRMAAVVHHGGAGTTAAGFRAGVPSIIIPFSNDQFAWGQRAYELGVGPQPIPIKKLTVEGLSHAIIQTHQSRMVDQAKSLGEKINAENGAADAARIITECVN